MTSDTCHRHGGTLPELLIALVGFSVMGAVVIVVTMTMYNALALLGAKIVVSDTLRNTMEQIGRDAQAAKTALTGSCASYSVSSTTSSTTLILDAGGGRTVYACANGSCNVTTRGELQTIKYGDSACTTVTTPLRTVAREVNVLNFDISKDANHRVQIDLGSSRREANYTYTAQLTSTFRWRGH